MPKVKFTKKNMPKPGGLVKALKEATRNAKPLDDLVEHLRDLVYLELKYKMPSDEFFVQYQKGEMGDDLEIMRWASLYKAYTRLKRKLDDDLVKYYAMPVAVS